MASALLGANARAATTTIGPITTHVADATAGVTCSDLFTGSDVCGHVNFTSAVSGTATLDATYNNVNFPIVQLHLCVAGTSGTASTVCPAGYTEVTCSAQTDVTNADGTITSSITCPVVSGQSYQLVIVPLFVDTCVSFPCSAGPGLDVTVLITLVSGGTVTTGNGTAAKVTGGGQVSVAQVSQEPFAIVGFDGTTKGQVRYSNNTASGCRFFSRAITSVVVSYNPTTGGGTAKITGTGDVVYPGGGKLTGVAFVAEATDSGTPEGDTFKISNSGACENALTAVVRGNVTVHKAS